MRKLFALFFTCLVLISCNSSKTKYNSIDRIEFGSGGGITGRYQTFVIDIKSRSILQSDGTLKRKLEQTEWRALSKELRKAEFTKINFNHPHNLSYFLSFEGKVNNKIVWGDSMLPAPEEVKALYTLLMNFVKQE